MGADWGASPRYRRRVSVSPFLHSATYPPTMPLPIVAICRAVLGATQVPEAEVRMGGKQAFTRTELLKFVRGASVIVPWVSERVDAELLDAAGPQLRAVCNYAVGVDNIDLAACKQRGVIVTNTPNAVTEGTADMTWAL